MTNASSLHDIGTKHQPSEFVRLTLSGGFTQSLFVTRQVGGGWVVHPSFTPRSMKDFLSQIAKVTKDHIDVLIESAVVGKPVIISYNGAFRMQTDTLQAIAICDEESAFAEDVMTYLVRT